MCCQFTNVFVNITIIYKACIVYSACKFIRSYCHTVLIAIWQMFSKFLIFYKLFHERFKRVKYRSSHPDVVCRKFLPRNFAKSTEKHLCQSLFLNKFAGPCNCIQKEALAQVFSCKFCEISKNAFFYGTPPVTASGIIARPEKREKLLPVLHSTSCNNQQLNAR